MAQPVKLQALLTATLLVAMIVSGCTRKVGVSANSTVAQNGTPNPNSMQTSAIETVIVATQSIAGIRKGKGWPTWNPPISIRPKRIISKRSQTMKMLAARRSPRSSSLRLITIAPSFCMKKQLPRAKIFRPPNMISKLPKPRLRAR